MARFQVSCPQMVQKGTYRRDQVGDVRPHFRVDDIVVDVCGLHFAQRSQRPRLELCHMSTTQTLLNSQLVLVIAWVLSLVGALHRETRLWWWETRRACRTFNGSSWYQSLGLLISLGVYMVS